METHVISIYVYMLWLPDSAMKHKIKMVKNKLKFLIRTTERLDR